MGAFRNLFPKCRTVMGTVLGQDWALLGISSWKPLSDCSVGMVLRTIRLYCISRERETGARLVCFAIRVRKSKAALRLMQASLPTTRTFASRRACCA
eukprot:1081519-Pleurochrysis_carterae.AAC.1